MSAEMQRQQRRIPSDKPKWSAALEPPLQLQSRLATWCLLPKIRARGNLTCDVHISLPQFQVPKAISIGERGSSSHDFPTEPPSPPKTLMPPGEMTGLVSDLARVKWQNNGSSQTLSLDSRRSLAWI